MKLSQNFPVLLVSFFAFAALSACSPIKTEVIEHRHWELNDSIRKTHSEQLLLNIVRLRYSEMPMFLQVSNITTSFSSPSSLGASGQLQSGGVGVLGLTGSLSYSESPTISWSLPESRTYLGRLMAPMGADQLTILTQAGWSPVDVLLVGTKKVNRLRNLEIQPDRSIYQPAQYENFIEVLSLLEPLRREDLIDFAYGAKSALAGAKFPIEQLDSRAIPDGLASGLQFMTRSDPGVIEPLKLYKPLFLRFSQQSDSDPRAQRLRALLNLDPSRYSFGIVDTANSSAEQQRSESGQLTQAFDTEALYPEVVLNNRSVLEVLHFASTYVSPPQGDLASMRASPSNQKPQMEWFSVLSSETEPQEAWLKVKYRDSWFYIASDDLRSRNSFMLLDALFASVVGQIPGAKPLLTLPVN